MLRQRSSQLQKHKTARMSRRIAVDQIVLQSGVLLMYAVGMADTQG